MHMHMHTRTHTSLHIFVKPSLLIAETKNNKTIGINAKEDVSEALTAFINKSIFHISFQMLVDGRCSFQISTYISDGNLKQASDPVTLTHSIIKPL